MSKEKTYHEVSPPPASEYLLKRPAVENLLKKAFKKPLTTIIAGAGFGKTQAVLAVLKSMHCNSAWIRLSQLDNHCVRFWERIVYSLKPYSQGLFESLLALGYPQSLVDFDLFLRLVSKELNHKERFILVLDNFHLIHNQSILDFIQLFVSANAKNFSIVLISRKRPDLSLTGMLSKGYLVAQITEDDLRFSKDEMNTYFHKQGINLGEDMSADIFSYTDGWIFAIFLIGMAIKKNESSKINPIKATKNEIFDLIEKEIFQKVSQDLQIFLIKVSILVIVPTGFLKELTDDPLIAKSEMMQLSQFIRYDSSSDCYYIHDLFKEFLLERHSQLSESAIKQIHLMAAKWYEKNNHKIEAIGHYKKYNLYNEIFTIILSFSSHVAKEMATFFIDLIQQAPEEVIRERPIIRVAMTRFMLNNNRIADAKQELLKIRKEYEALSENDENLAILGEVYIILALISIINIDYEFVDLFKKADKCLPNGSTLIDSRLNVAEGLNVSSIKNAASGELKRHQDALFNAAPYASRVMNGCGYGLEYLNAAESSLYTGDLKGAKKFAYEAIYRARQYQQYDIECMANFVLVRIFTAKGKYEEIVNIFDQMKNSLETLQAKNCIFLYDIINGWFLKKIGQPRQVAKWIKYEETTHKMLTPVILGREYLVRSDCLLIEERYDELLAFMKQTDKMYELRGILFAVLQNKITKAIIYHYRGDYPKSLDMFNDAYELSHPNNLIMQYIEYGNKMRTLIHALRQNKDCKIPKEWLNKIYTKSSTYSKQLSQVVAAYNTAHELENTTQIELSKRETEVLSYLSRGMTRKEIAGSCYISIGTVDSTLKNIYAKLGVSKAVDAVLIAREKNLL